MKFDLNQRQTIETRQCRSAFSAEPRAKSVGERNYGEIASFVECAHEMEPPSIVVNARRKLGIVINLSVFAAVDTHGG